MVNLGGSKVDEKAGDTFEQNIEWLQSGVKASRGKGVGGRRKQNLHRREKQKDGEVAVIQAKSESTIAKEAKSEAKSGIKVQSEAKSENMIPCSLTEEEELEGIKMQLRECTADNEFETWTNTAWKDIAGVW